MMLGAIGRSPSPRRAAEEGEAILAAAVDNGAAMLPLEREEADRLAGLRRAHNRGRGDQRHGRRPGRARNALAGGAAVRLGLMRTGPGNRCRDAENGDAGEPDPVGAGDRRVPGVSGAEPLVEGASGCGEREPGAQRGAKGAVVDGGPTGHENHPNSSIGIILQLQ